MEDKELRSLIADTGRMLLEKGLVARTWGNISVRKDATHFAISPSGLSYTGMTPEDVPIYDSVSKEYEGTRKPSSEKKIHAAAYEIFADVNFVVHTHQDYATAVGLVGTDILELTEDEKNLLGEIRVAGYGLPGTKTLKKNVADAMSNGSKVVLMLHHGAIILGSDRDDAVHKAEVLEEVCKRAVRKIVPEPKVQGEEISESFKNACKDAVIVTDPDVVELSKGKSFKCELDDIAQMLGTAITVVDNTDSDILNGLNKQDLVLVRNAGAVILTEDPDDAEALSMLIKKSAISKRLTQSLGVNRSLNSFDCALMRFVYKKKYSKKKG